MKYCVTCSTGITSHPGKTSPTVHLDLKPRASHQQVTNRRRIPPTPATDKLSDIRNVHMNDDNIDLGSYV